MKLFEPFRFCIPTVAILLIFMPILCPFEADAQFENPNNSTLSSEEDQDSYKSAGQNLSPNLTMLFSNVGQSVVHISEAREVSLGSSQGSGFVFDNLGHIVTNYYTVADPQESQETTLNHRDFHVTFLDGTTRTGKVVGADLYSELAVIKLENITGTRLIPLSLGNSSQIRIGQPVLAIGNVLGLSGSMTEGIVSGFGRILPSSVPQGDLLFRQQDTQSFLIPNLVQTDAAINQGNSGGPLLNIAGEVIGMNTQFFSDTGIYAGIGAAIPSDIIKRVVPELISTGTYRHPYIGIAGVDMYPEIAREMGLNESRGFLVTEVTSGSPAERSGIRGGEELKDINGRQIELGGDVIVAVDSTSIRKIEDLISYLQSERSVGDTVIISVLRDGRTQDIRMTVEARPTQRQLETEQIQQQRPTLGINTINMTEQIAVRMNLTALRNQLASEDDQQIERGGVLVIDLIADGPAERAGIKGGFVLADINGTPVEIGGDVIVKIDDTVIPNVNALNEFVEKKDIGDIIQVTVIRQGQPLKIPITVGSTVELETAQSGNGSNLPTESPIDSYNDFFGDLYDRCTETFGPFVCNPLFRR
jgi:serine protease Do